LGKQISNASPVYPFASICIPAERQAAEVKRALENATTHRLRLVNCQEYDFWEHLKKAVLLPGSKAFGLEEELKSTSVMLLLFCFFVLLFFLLFFVGIVVVVVVGGGDGGGGGGLQAILNA
jgi:hypothetical protein